MEQQVMHWSAAANMTPKQSLRQQRCACKCFLHLSYYQTIFTLKYCFRALIEGHASIEHQQRVLMSNLLGASRKNTNATVRSFFLCIVCRIIAGKQAAGVFISVWNLSPQINQFPNWMNIQCPTCKCQVLCEPSRSFAIDNVISQLLSQDPLAKEEVFLHVSKYYEEMLMISPDYIAVGNAKTGVWASLGASEKHRRKTCGPYRYSYLLQLVSYCDRCAHDCSELLKQPSKRSASSLILQAYGQRQRRESFGKE